MKLDYGQLLRRAWDIIWAHKFLILLGVIVALTNGGNASGSGYRFSDRDFNQTMPRDFEGFPEVPDLQAIPRDWGVPIALGGVLLVVVIALAIVLGLVLWVFATLARGGLIAAVDTIAAGGVSSFSQAFSAGLQKGWRLLGIGILPAIPGVLLLLGGLGIFGFSAGLTQILDLGRLPLGSGLLALIAGLGCIIAPIALALGLLRNFADRACMLENLGVFASYRRGWQVLSANIEPVVILFLIQIGIGIALALLGALPGVLLALCCVLWPVLLLIQGAIAAYFSTLWTLAWREWTVPNEGATA